MVMQWTVNPPPAGTTGSIPVFSTKYAPVAQSGLEQWSTKPKVGGSNPSGRTTTIEVWCNGNTTDFDSVILGSSPSTSTKAMVKLV